jgi:hypothetical protein
MTYFDKLMEELSETMKLCHDSRQRTKFERDTSRTQVSRSALVGSESGTHCVIILRRVRKIVKSDY